jgi:hypothetical protein
MQRRLELLSGKGGTSDSATGTFPSRETPLAPRGLASGVLDDGRGAERPPAPIPSGKKRVDLVKNWFKRLWSSDARNALRQPAPWLAAYYWNGGTPSAHDIRDVSSTGLYLLTEDTQGAKPVISVKVRAVRWGNDGVGLQFVLAEDARDDEPACEANKCRLERFLERVNNRG